MSDGPWACIRCGAVIRGKLPPRGLAHRFDPRPYCPTCLRQGSLAPTPTLPVAADVPLRRPA